MPMPSIYVTRFFQLITVRRFAEAERVLLRLRQKKSTTEWNTGYFQALKGMLLAQRSNDDRYVFLSNVNFKNQNELQNYRREFLKQSRNKLHADYDRGYFTAWASYMRVLAKLEFATDKTKIKTPKKKEVKPKAETGKTEKEVTEEKKQEEKPEVKMRKEAEKEVKVETEKREIEKPESTEGIEARQRT
ncbi:hypothetical protein KAI30_00735, partial [Candidatus Bathyarchaeota archaeon]|nr:hypothetical protein [Candidatus Bathyarchaeota archaeon]